MGWCLSVKPWSLLARHLCLINPERVPSPFFFLERFWGSTRLKIQWALFSSFLTKHKGRELLFKKTSRIYKLYSKEFYQMKSSRQTLTEVIFWFSCIQHFKKIYALSNAFVQYPTVSAHAHSNQIPASRHCPGFGSAAISVEEPLPKGRSCSLLDAALPTPFSSVFFPTALCHQHHSVMEALLHTHRPKWFCPCKAETRNPNYCPCAFTLFWKAWEVLPETPPFQKSPALCFHREPHTQQGTTA